MSTLQLTRAELDKYDALTPKINNFTQRIVNADTNQKMPERVKATIAVTHISLFASQFRRNIELWDGTAVPINAISFALVDSGSGKDRSNRTAERCFSAGYDILEREIEIRNKKQAIQRAIADGEDEDSAHQWDIYKAYLHPVPPVNTSITTGPGLIKIINDTDLHSLRSTLIFTGELGDALAYDGNAMDNITIMAELYDLGVKEATYTKGVEFRSKAINGQALSALLVGSPPLLMYDESVKRKFQLAFMSKLARRSWFCYAPEVIKQQDYSTVDEAIADKFRLETESKQARAMLEDDVRTITQYQLKHDNQALKLHPDIFKLFTTYQMYNEELAESLSNRESVSALVRRHLQWKALKLAGAFAIINMHEHVTPQDYIEAIQFCELLKDDMELFEQALNKLYYERFSDYIQTMVTSNGRAIVDAHDIKKRGFLPSITKAKLQELVTLCAGYDRSGIYTIVGDGSAIQYEPIVKTSRIGVSFKEINTDRIDELMANGCTHDELQEAKSSIGITTSYGYELYDTTFDELGTLLQGSYAYSPFKFKDGVRGKDNILGGTKWLVLDVDESILTASEVHFMLHDINHHIALSSDPNNEYKFKVLLELDSIVDVDATIWKQFFLLIADDLAIKVDPLPQSQIFYSYAGRKVYTQLEADPLPIRDYLMQATERAATKETPIKQLTSAQSKALLADPTQTFSYAFNCPSGQGSRNMIRAAYHACDLGATKEETLQLMHDINEYWDTDQGSMSDKRFNGIIEQVSRMF